MLNAARRIIPYITPWANTANPSRSFKTDVSTLSLAETKLPSVYPENQRKILTCSKGGEYLIPVSNALSALEVLRYNKLTILGIGVYEVNARTKAIRAITEAERSFDRIFDKHEGTGEELAEKCAKAAANVIDKVPKHLHVYIAFTTTEDWN